MITAADILAELDRAINDSQVEAQNVIEGKIYNSAHPNQIEYLYFLNSAIKAFRGMRQYLRSEDFAEKCANKKQENKTK